MRVPCLLAIALLVLLSKALPAQQGARIHMHRSETDATDAFLYEPEIKGPAVVASPAIILIPDRLGLTEWIKDEAATFSKAGYVVVAIDPYRGQMAPGTEQSNDLSQGVSQSQMQLETRTQGDLDAAMIFLRKQMNVQQDRIAAVGWGTGADAALELATREPHLRAVVLNEGTWPPRKTSLLTIHAAVLGNFAAPADGHASAALRAFKRQLRGPSAKLDLKLYPSATQGFEDPKSANYREADATDAQQRTSTFLTHWLKR